MKNTEKNKIRKKDIRISFASFVAKSNRDVLLAMLTEEFSVIIDEYEYDYYFVDDVIYYSLENMQEVLNAKKTSVKIMFALEAVFPDLNIFDYAISFINQFDCQDRVLHLPYLELLNKMGYAMLISNLDCDKNVDINKEKFCNFIYGNSRAHCMRETLFYKISQYKTVDSLGKFLNNVPIRNTREDVDWLYKSIDLKRPYKFSIAAENATFPGYTSEKLITSMLAKTIPIYWGNPDVGMEYNQQAFINVMDYSSIDDVIDVIRQLDEDDEKYKNMISRPWRTENQKKKFQENVSRFYQMFYNIFYIDIKKAYRRPEGCWPDYMYPDFFKTFIQSQEKRSLINRLKRLMW